jgi:hypothetical protein
MEADFQVEAFPALLFELAGCPPLFDLSFKVPRSIAHNPYSGLAILPLAARLNVSATLFP